MKKFTVTMVIHAVDLTHARAVLAEVSNRVADARESGDFDRGSISGDIDFVESSLEEIT